MTECDNRQLVTGNRLRDGIPVYYAGAGAWSPTIADAVLVTAEAAAALLADAQSGPGPSPVIAPYLIEAAAAPDGIRPVSLRERIRAFGPTV